MNKVKLNLGAGSIPVLDFSDIDIKDGNEVYPLLSYENNSVDEIYASHILEHFSYRQTFAVLKEWVRVLKPDCWISIAVPDFNWITYNWNQPNCEFRDIIEMVLMGGHLDKDDYHKAIFTETKLTQLMQAAGLTDIKHWTSQVKDCASLPLSLNLKGRKQ